MKEQETFTVYKAVRVVGGDFVSSVTGHPKFPESKGWALEYVLGEETVAHWGSVGILCFNNPGACKMYLYSIPYLRPGYEFAILECTTAHVPHRPFCILRNSGHFQRLVTHYNKWRLATIERGADVVIPPYGTCVVPSLTPRRIYKEDTQWPTRNDTPKAN